MEKAREMRQAELKAMGERIHQLQESIKIREIEQRKLLIQIIARITIIVLACGYLGYTLAKPYAHYVLINQNLELQAEYRTYDIQTIKGAN